VKVEWVDGYMCEGWTMGQRTIKNDGAGRDGSCVYCMCIVLIGKVVSILYCINTVWFGTV